MELDEQDLFCSSSNEVDHSAQKVAAIQTVQESLKSLISTMLLPRLRAPSLEAVIHSRSAASLFQLATKVGNMSALTFEKRGDLSASRRSCSDDADLRRHVRI